MLTDTDRLAEYQPYWAARAELQPQLGDVAQADIAFVRAIGLEADPAVRPFLERKRVRICEEPASALNPSWA